MKLHKCPVCEGRGLVPMGFYYPPDMTYTTSTEGSEKCRSCNGKGIIKQWEQGDETLDFDVMTI